MHEAAAEARIPEAQHCPTCGAEFGGPWCQQCGEARPDPHELSVRHAVHDAVHEFTHLDGKIFRTLWLLVRRPGLLTAEYWAGRRKPYIRPLRLYIVIAAIHLLAMSATVYKYEFFRDLDSRGALRRTVERTAARQHTPTAAVEAQLSGKIASVYSVAQYLAVLAFALLPFLLYRRARPHYVQHLIFSLHVYAFYFLLTACVSPLLTPSLWRRSPLPLVTLAYLYFAVRRLYGERWHVAAAKAVALRLGLFAVEFVALAIALTASIFWLRLAH